MSLISAVDCADRSKPGDLWAGSVFRIRYCALISALRRSAEEYVTEDWAAVARAINQRTSELGMRQRELSRRSHVSQATVRELQRNTVHRRRSARTLEALSLALGWHPEHLLAVLEGREPPLAGEPVFKEDDVPSRLSAIERQLGQITRQLDEMNARLRAGTGSDGERAG